MVKSALGTAMHLRRRAVAPFARCSFGRRAIGVPQACVSTETKSSLSADLRLFGLTFVGGFLFVSVYLF
jgi:hypothetical protein